MDKRFAAVLGFIMGIYLDVLTSKQVGISAIVLTFIGYICGFFDKSFSKESKITIILMVIGSTFVYEVICYIYSSIFQNEEKALQFMVSVYNCDWDGFKPRRMMHQVKRFVNLAEDVEIIRGMLKDRLGIDGVDTFEIGSTIVSHSGAGLVGLVYLK